jgi:hypothetical protein
MIDHFTARIAAAYLDARNHALARGNHAEWTRCQNVHVALVMHLELAPLILPATSSLEGD